MGCGLVETIPRGSTLLMHLFFRGWGANNPTLALVIQGNLAPVYINMFEMKKKKNCKKEINYLSSINIKENCKTQSGVTMLLLQNHLVIAPGKILLSLISVQQNRLGVPAKVHVSACCRGHLAACQPARHTPAENCAWIPLEMRLS